MNLHFSFIKQYPIFLLLIFHLLFTILLRKEVKKLSLILAGEVDFEAPKDTQIQSPTTRHVMILEK